MYVPTLDKVELSHTEGEEVGGHDRCFLECNALKLPTRQPTHLHLRHVREGGAVHGYLRKGGRKEGMNEVY